MEQQSLPGTARRDRTVGLQIGIVQLGETGTLSFYATTYLDGEPVANHVERFGGVGASLEMVSGLEEFILEALATAWNRAADEESPEPPPPRG